MSEIFVWESAKGSGWKVVEAWRDKHGCPYGRYVILADGLLWKEAIDYAHRLRMSCEMA
jgi:hypothetical protein